MVLGRLRQGSPLAAFPLARARPLGTQAPGLRRPPVHPSRRRSICKRLGSRALHAFGNMDVFALYGQRSTGLCEGLPYITYIASQRCSACSFS